MNYKNPAALLRDGTTPFDMLSLCTIMLKMPPITAPVRRAWNCTSNHASRAALKMEKFKAALGHALKGICEQELGKPYARCCHACLHTAEMAGALKCTAAAFKMVVTDSDRFTVSAW